MDEVRHDECQNKPHYFEMFYNESENGDKPSELSNRPRGFGDTVANFLHKVGVKKKKGCGCSKRQEFLNKLIPYKN